MDYINERDIEAAIAEIDVRLKLNGGFVLVHQIALGALSVDRNAYLPAVDICVPVEILQEAGIEPTTKVDYIEASAVGVPFRIWTSIAGENYDSLAKDGIRTKEAEYIVANPRKVLELLEESPNWKTLLEERAYLAEILYESRLSDEQLALFHSYVKDS